MSGSILTSGQSTNCPDRHDRKFCCCTSTSTPGAPAPASAFGCVALIERYKRCGKPGCSCAEGRGHGPKYYLSVSFPGERPQIDYIPQELQPQASEYVGNLQHVREILEQVCEINRELLRRREAL